MAEIENTKKWYSIIVPSGQENRVKGFIEQKIAQIGLEDSVAQLLVPMEKVIYIKNGKKIRKERPYFPGYVIIEADFSGEVPNAIRSIIGVDGFSEEKKGVPVPLEESEVHKFLEKIDQ